MKKIIALLILLVTFIVFAVVVSRINPKGQNSSIIPTTILPEPSSYIALSSQDYKSVYRAGEPINILVYAHSNNTEIAGFDVSLLYDHDAYQFVSEKKIHPDFDMTVRDAMSSDGKYKLIITGTVPVQKTSLPVLTDSPLVALNFIPTVRAATASASAAFTVEYTKGSTSESNLIDSQSNDILEGVKNIPLTIYLEVGQVVLTPGVVYRVDDGLMIKLTQVHIPDEGCADCITDASIEVKDPKTGKSQTLVFESGGIDGRMELSKKAFSYQLEIIEMKKDQVTLRYGK